MANGIDIAEVNRTREAAGLDPLPDPNAKTANIDTKSTNKNDDASSSSEDDSEEEFEDTIETRTAAADDNWRKLQAEKDAKKEREQRRAALKKKQDAEERKKTLEGPTLGDGGGDDVTAWLKGENKRQKAINKKRAEAQKEEEEKRKNKPKYTEADLTGTRVAHDMGDIAAGEDQILTLKDANVEDESGEDELENAQLVEKEKTKERLDLKRKTGAYDPNEVDENGDRSMLGQYDETIGGKKRKNFALGDKSAVTKDNMDTDGQPKRMKFDLSDFHFEEPTPASDYVDVSKVKVKNKKKKNGKTNTLKKIRFDSADDGQADVTMSGVEKLDSSEGVTKDTAATKKRGRDALLLDDEDADLQRRRAETRRNTLKNKQSRKEREAELMRRVREANAHDEAASKNSGEYGMVLDETSRFVDELDDRDFEAEAREREAKELARMEKLRERQEFEDTPDDYFLRHPMTDDANVDSYSREDTEMPDEATAIDDQTGRADGEADEADEEEAEEKGSTGGGLGQWVKTLADKGIWKGEGSHDSSYEFRRKQRFLADIRTREDQAKKKAQEERGLDRANKLGHMTKAEREEYAQRQNAIRDFTESKALAEAFDRDYKPNIELKYIDKFGRNMNAREAFKDLSHQFHGKGSGNMKTEKHIKKVQAERAREAQSSLDTTKARGMSRVAGAQAKKNKQAGVRLQ